MRLGTLVRTAALALGTLLIAVGCGSGSDPDASAQQQPSATASANPVNPRPATSADPLPPGSQTPPPALPLPGAVTGSTLPGPPTAPPTPAAQGPGPGPDPRPATPAPGSARIELPTLDTYSYALSGTSTLGPPPKTLKLDVSATATTPVSQLWSLDMRRGGGNGGGGIVEDLTLSRQDDGVYLSGYRLDASTGLAAVELDFAAATPVLFTPDGGAVGRAWSFDLKSTDGCAAAHGEGVVVAAGAATAPRHFRLTIALRSIGPATCVALTGKRVLDFFHPVAALLPTRLDAVLDGRLAGVPVASDTKATAAPAPPRTAARRTDPA